MKSLFLLGQSLVTSMFFMPGCGKEPTPQQIALNEPAAFASMQDRLVGRPAMEISGADTMGKHFQLSDFRGNVVLLDFWGNW